LFDVVAMRGDGKNIGYGTGSLVCHLFSRRCCWCR
jgi:hypothetical protein